MSGRRSVRRDTYTASAVGALTLVLFSQFHGARAASFNCAGAGQPVERLICDNQSLSELDTRLGEIYGKSLAELSPRAARRYRQAQRAWLAYWPALCADAAGKIAPESGDTLQCAETEYLARIATLKLQGRTAENLLAFPVSHYDVVQSTAGLDFIKRAHHVATRMTIDVEAAPAASRGLAQALDQWLGLPSAETAMTESDEMSTSDTELELVFTHSASSLIISAQKTSFLMGHGAAHPLSLTARRHFNLRAERPIETRDIFEGEDWLEALTHLTEEALKDQLAEYYTVERVESLRMLVAQPERWSFAQAGLTVTFNPYEVAPYVAGAPEVTVPWSSLRAWLTPAFAASLPEAAGVMLKR